MHGKREKETDTHALGKPEMCCFIMNSHDSQHNGLDRLIVAGVMSTPVVL